MVSLYTAIFGKEFALILMGIPIGWGFVITLLSFMLKIWLIPLIAQMWKDRKEKATEEMAVLVGIKDSLNKMNFDNSSLKNEIKEEFLNMRSKVEKFSIINHKLDELLSDTNGTMDERLSLRHFASDLDKRHLQLMIFFRLRCKSNHIQGNEELIARRYVREAERNANKHTSMLFDLSHKGTTLNTFWGPHGAASYFRHIAVELYNIQLLGSVAWESYSDNEKMNNTIHEVILKEEDISDVLDRNITKFMTMYKEYLITGKCFAELQIQHDLKIIPTETSNKEIKFL